LKKGSLSKKQIIYLFIGAIFFITLAQLIWFYGIAITLAIVGFFGFIALLSMFSSEYTAHRRKKSWKKKNGTVCFARKDSWTVKEYEGASIDVALFIFLCGYFLITIPLLYAAWSWYLGHGSFP